MLKIEPPDYRFCPFCGKKLQLKTEEERERKFCSACRWTYYPSVSVAVAAVIVKNGKVLLVKRNREPYKELWMFPAGFIEFGEHPLGALEREVKEETGLKVEKADFIEVCQQIDDPREVGHLLFFFRVAVSGIKLETDRAENQEVAWFDLKNPPKIGWQSHQKVMKLLQRGN